jgi:hypothetical protein
VRSTRPANGASPRSAVTPIGTLDWPPVLVQERVKIYGPRSQ